MSYLREHIEEVALGLEAKGVEAWKRFLLFADSRSKLTPPLCYGVGKWLNEGQSEL